MSEDTYSGASRRPFRRAVKVWLYIGLVMIFVQIVVGGITRLTGSGLSITKWEIVMGTVPPLNASQWEEAFELYQATPQYQKINEGMSMGEFKFIYFWEYIHRLWARSMGFVFLIPFLFFWRKGAIEPALMRRLGITVLLTAVVAMFGWIMVASGLVNRPWVNAYKLTLHLSLALIVYSYLWWTILLFFPPKTNVLHTTMLKKWGLALLILTGVQIALGGMMSGMKAALVYPTWPDMNGEWLPALLFDGANWTGYNFVHYDAGPFMSALVHILHRSVAYALIIIGLWFFFKALPLAKEPALRTGLWLLLAVLAGQVLLGILTVINSIGTIPVGLGVLHQAGAVLLLTVLFYVYFQVRKVRVS
jgi:heme a synthase